MKFIRGRPLIRNASHPDDLFTDDEKEHIKKALSVSYQRERYNRMVKVNEPDRRIRGDLLRIARFHGYFATGVRSNKSIIWACMTQNKWKIAQVIISIMSCNECGTNFHAYHYEDTDPDIVCNDCQKVRKNKITPPNLKKIPRVEKMSNKIREKRIDHLRDQIPDDLPF